MAIWDKLKTELDRAGRVAQSALDEGKVRLESLRVRQLADRAAQALGYAVYNARRNGGDLDADTYERLSTTLAAHEAEAQRLEAQLEQAKASRAADFAGDAPSGESGESAGGTAGPTPTPDHVDPAMGDSGSSTTATPSGTASTEGPGSGPGTDPGYRGGYGTPPYGGPGSGT